MFSDKKKKRKKRRNLKTMNKRKGVIMIMKEPVALSTRGFPETHCNLIIKMSINNSVFFWFFPFCLINFSPKDQFYQLEHKMGTIYSQFFIFHSYNPFYLMIMTVRRKPGGLIKWRWWKGRKSLKLSFHIIFSSRYSANN